MLFYEDTNLRKVLLQESKENFNLEQRIRNKILGIRKKREGDRIRQSDEENELKPETTSWGGKELIVRKLQAQN